MNDSLDKLDRMVLGAIKSYKPERPAMRGDLWSMVLIQRQCVYIGDLENSLKRLKASGAVKYSRKPAGWVAV